MFINLVKQNPAGAEQPPQSKKQEKRLQQRLKAAHAAMPKLTNSYLTAKLLNHLEFTEEFEYLCMFALVLFINAGGAAVMRAMMGLFPQHALTIGATGLFYVVFLLYRVSLMVLGQGNPGTNLGAPADTPVALAVVEWAHEVIKKQDKGYMAVVAVVAVPLAYVVLTVLPGLAFDPAGAAEELTGRSQLLLQSKLKAVKEVPVLVGDPNLIAMPLGVVAGLLSLKYGRILQQLMSPPMWAKRFCDQGWGWRLVAQLGFTVQLMLIPLWVPTMADALFLPRHAVAVVRGLMLLLAAVLQGAAMPTLVQAYLYTPALSCWVIQNNPQFSDATKEDLMKRHIQITLAHTVKVALQLSVVPVLLLVSSIIYLLMAFPLPEDLHSKRVSEWDKKPSVLFECVPGFVGWWTSVAYLSWASLGVLLGRLKSSD
eukprot:gene3634-3895_t